LNEADETYDIESFGEIICVQSYLRKFGRLVVEKALIEQKKNREETEKEEKVGELFKRNISMHIKFKEEIKKRHDRKEIQMLLGRIEDMIDNKNALSYTTAAFYVLLAFVLGNQLKYSNDYLLVVIEDIRIQITVVIFVAVLAVGLWGYFTYKDKIELNELSCYKRLLQECLDEIPNRSFK